ncbi:P-loop containing nucleoside triphosphate hydrolase protein [Phlebopus sp. FC_14]|nr:P-loop containing nucleoside triphosphate hydrolase protein [Phlebopus sp. FC_14]
MRFIISVASFLLLAGQAIALSIDVGGSLGNISATEFLNCQTPCNNATTLINNCGNNDQCVCDPSTVSAITSCQQCMFNDLIDKFAQSSDPRAGSTTALTAYAAACLASVNITIPTSFITLELPSNWDGPFGLGLGVPATVLTVAVGVLLGGGGLLLLSNITCKSFLLLVRRRRPHCRALDRRVASKIHTGGCRNMAHSPRTSTFIGIRNFFKNLARQTDSSPKCLQRRIGHSLFSTTASASAGAATQKPSQHELPLDEYFSEYSPLAPSTRFDWRLRAPSRFNGTQCSPQKREGGSVYVKRIAPPYIQVRPGEPYYDEIQAYNNRFLPLLGAEQAEEEAVLRERLSTWSLQRLREEGYCLTDLSAFWMEAPQFRRPIACFLLGPGIIFPQHRFENGTQVLVSRLDPLREVPVRGSVITTTASQLRVAFEDKFDLDEGSWRLDVGRSNVVFDRMRFAIAQFNQDPALQEADSAPDRQYIMQGTHLRDVLLRSFSPASTSLHEPLQAPDDVAYVSHERLEHQSREERDHGGAFKDDMRIQSWARRHARRDPIQMDGDPVLEGLNPTQIRAVAMMIGEKISLVQGPPGTGKTKTIIEAVKLLKTHFEVHHPILVCTYTNVAVDNLVEGLATAGVKPLRVGYGGKVKSSLAQHTLDYKLEQHPLKPKVEKLLEEQKDIEARRTDLVKNIATSEKSTGDRFRERLERMRNALIMVERKSMAVKSKLYAMHQEMLRDISSAADVICTTCITSASVALNVLDFPVVFLDEASMSTEPASLIPLMKGSRHVALIGDHKQLPPVITSREAQLKGLGTSLFERLTEEGVVPSIMLDIQYRMHPSISRFPSLEFYNFSLQDGTVDAAGNISPKLLPPLSSHLEVDRMSGNRPSVVFLDHGGSETAKDRSRVNWNEAHIVCSIVEDLLIQNEQLRGEEIGIIAPYAAQISLLTRLLNTDAKYRKRFLDTLGDYRVMQLSDIEVKTVDGFEGREKEVIVFSTVRNNSSGYIGFLADRRRLNVGLTRAKRGLFVVGSISTLKAGKMAKGRVTEGGVSAARVGKGAEAWRRYAEYLSEERMVLELTGERLHRVLSGYQADSDGDVWLEAVVGTGSA